jgi:HAD superfamily hydrolase (TIGR01549 family)
MTIKAVIFDLDGTIVTFNLDYKTLRGEVRSYLLNIGVPASLLTVNENIFDMLKKTEIFMKHQGKSGADVEKIRKETMSIAEKHEIEAAEQTSTLPGAVETLKILKQSGLKIGLCTMNGKKSMDYILKRFNLAGFFDATIPRDKVNQVKPNTEHLETTLKALDAKAAETLVVGDSINDMQGAKDLRAVAVGLPTGISTKEKMISYGANFIITSITDLPILIERINKPEPPPSKRLC